MDQNLKSGILSQPEADLMSAYKVRKMLITQTTGGKPSTWAPGVTHELTYFSCSFFLPVEFSASHGKQEG